MTRVSLSPDGKTLVTASHLEGGTAWDVATGKAVRSLPYLYPNRPLAFSPDGRFLGANGVWDLCTGKALLHVPGHCGAFVDGERALMTVTLERAETRLVALSTGKTLRAFPGSFVGLARDARTVTTRVALARESRTVVWDLATGKQRHELKGPTLRCQHEGRLVLSRGPSAVSLHDLLAGEGRTLERSRLAALDSEDQAAFSPDGSLLAADADEFLCVWDTRSGKLRHRIRLDAPEPPRRRVLAYGVWIEQPLYPRSPAQVRFSPDGKRLAVAFHGDHPVPVWDVVTGKLVHRRAVGHTLTFSADGATLVTGEGRSARFWEAATGTDIRQPSSPARRP